jgi:hypothetical protein
VHGKFFAIDEHRRDPVVPFEELLPILVDGA